MSDLEIRFGWQCPICGRLYDTEDLAKNCLKNHVEYTMETSKVLSNPWPINIRVWKEVAGLKVEWKDYTPEKGTHQKK